MRDLAGCRGVYLACIFYHDERVLITDEDKCIPMVEVDESTDNISADFSWMLKLSYQWENLRNIRSDLEKLAKITSYSLRNKFLNAAMQMQVSVVLISRMR